MEMNGLDHSGPFALTYKSLDIIGVTDLRLDHSCVFMLDYVSANAGTVPWRFDGGSCCGARLNSWSRVILY